MLVLTLSNAEGKGTLTRPNLTHPLRPRPGAGAASTPQETESLASNVAMNRVTMDVFTLSTRHPRHGQASS